MNQPYDPFAAGLLPPEHSWRLSGNYAECRPTYDPSSRSFRSDAESRFRCVLMSVILPVTARTVEGCDEPPRVGGFFLPGRFRGLSRIDMNSGGDSLDAAHEAAEHWLSGRLWVATGGRDSSHRLRPREDIKSGANLDDPPIAFPLPPTDSTAPIHDENARWNGEMDSHCAPLPNYRIAYFRNRLGNTGFVELRAVEILRFSGSAAESRNDFIVLHLVLHNPTPQQLQNFTSSLRTGEVNPDLHPTPRQSRANWAFSLGERVRSLSVPQLLEFHAKMSILGLARNDKNESQSRNQLAKTPPLPDSIFWQESNEVLTMDP